MRVEALDINALAMNQADMLTYLELKGLGQKIHVSSLQKNKGSRFLRDNQFRGIDIYEVIKMLNLNRTDSRLMVLSLLKRSDLIHILYLLDKQKLINGLRFFDKLMLLKLMTRLPKRDLIKMLRRVFSIEGLSEKMNTAELLNILRSDKVDNYLLVKAFHDMEMHFLLQLMAKLMNQDMSHLSHPEMMDILFKTHKRQILEALKLMSFRALTPLVGRLMKAEPELLMNMSNEFIFKLFSKMSKPTLLDTFNVLPKEIIIENFLSLLPDKFLILVAAQIDTSQLQDYLISNHPNLLVSLGTDMAA